VDVQPGLYVMFCKKSDVTRLLYEYKVIREQETLLEGRYLEVLLLMMSNITCCDFRLVVGFLL